jgi:hypothetical protein
MFFGPQDVGVGLTLYTLKRGLQISANRSNRGQPLVTSVAWLRADRVIRD